MISRFLTILLEICLCFAFAAHKAQADVYAEAEAYIYDDSGWIVDFDEDVGDVHALAGASLQSEYGASVAFAGAGYGELACLTMSHASFGSAGPYSKAHALWGDQFQLQSVSTDSPTSYPDEVLVQFGFAGWFRFLGGRSPGQGAGAHVTLDANMWHGFMGMHHYDLAYVEASYYDNCDAGVSTRHSYNDFPGTWINAESIGDSGRFIAVGGVIAFPVGIDPETGKSWSFNMELETGASAFVGDDPEMPQYAFAEADFAHTAQIVGITSVTGEALNDFTVVFDSGYVPGPLVPEPSGFLLLISGSFALFGYVWRRRRRVV